MQKKWPLNSHQKKICCKIGIFRTTSKKAVILFCNLMLQSSSTMLAPFNKYCNCERLWGLGFGLGSKFSSTRFHFLESFFIVGFLYWPQGTLRSTCETDDYLAQQLWPYSSSPPLLCCHFLFPTSPQTFPVCMYHHFYSCGCVCKQLQKCSWHFGLNVGWFVATSIYSCWRDVRK